MAKTPEYTRKAIQNYNNKFDRIAVNLPKGTKQEIKDLTGKSCNAFISALVIKELERIKTNKTEDLNKAPTPKKTPEISKLYEIYKGKLHEFVTQLEIQEKYGNDVLFQLSDYAKKADQAEDNPGE